MKKNFTYGMLLAGLFVAACSNEEFATEAITEQTPTSKVVVTATMPLVPETRLDCKEQQKTDDEGNPVVDEEGNPVMELSLKWEPTDAISVMQDADGSPVKFSQPDDATIITENGTSTTTFSGTTIVNYASRYYAVYPETTDRPTSITLDMKEQNGKLMGDKVYMYDYNKVQENTLDFKFRHLTSVLKLTLNLTYEGELTTTGTATDPKVSTRANNPSKLKSISVWGEGLKSSATVDITTESDITYKADGSYRSSNVITLTPEDETIGFPITNGQVTVYLHFLPDSDIERLTIRAEDDLNTTYFGTVTRKAESLIAGTMYEANVPMEWTQLGYLMLQNGHTIAPYKYDAATATGDEVAIGLVAYYYQGEDSDYPTPENQKLDFIEMDEGYIAEPKGLVLALKDAKTSSFWGYSSNTSLGKDYQCGSIGRTAYSEGYNGYYLKTQMGDNLSQYTAAEAAANFTTNVAPANSSGWYLPSIGEWMMMVGRYGIGKCFGIENIILNGWYETGRNTFDSVTNNFNNALSPAYNYDRISLETGYWSATEANDGNAWCITDWTDYGKHSVYFFSNAWKSGYSYKYNVRPILAFSDEIWW